MDDRIDPKFSNLFDLKSCRKVITVGNFRTRKSYKIRGPHCSHFSILFQLRKSKFEKIDFLKILPICKFKTRSTSKKSENFSPRFWSFYNWRWKYIKNWLLPLLFSEFHRAVLEKPIIFNFVRFLSSPRDEIQKSVSYISFSLPSSVSWKKPHDDIWNS